MKKAIVILLLLVTAVSLFATNGQKVIPLESDVYSAIDALYILEGKYDFIFGESTDHQFTLGAEVDF